jgi:hypothetical protein
MRKALQFSIRGVMFVTAAICVAVAVLGRPPSMAQVVGTEVLAILFFSTSFIAAVEAAGAYRHFWIGFAISTGLAGAFSTFVLPLTIMFVTDDPNKSSVMITVADMTALLVPAFWLFAPINGLLCVAVRGFVRIR